MEMERIKPYQMMVFMQINLLAEQHEFGERVLKAKHCRPRPDFSIDIVFICLSSPPSQAILFCFYAKQKNHLEEGLGGDTEVRCSTIYFHFIRAIR